MESKKFFAATPWSVIEDINTFLCERGGYQFGRTSDGYADARSLWENNFDSSLTLIEAADVCRRCHRLAPFLFLNGNTFANVAKVSLENALKDLPKEIMTASRTAIGHYVAGTIGKDELAEILRGNQ